jgi:DNA-binding transcriptional ArsR family regulator
MPTNASSRTIVPEREAEDVLTVDRPEQLQALGDATRWRILGYLLDGPASIQELAVALGRAKGTIGHHVRVLERAGLIRLAETRRVRGVTEKRYLRVAQRFQLPKEGDELPSGVDPGLMKHLPLHSALAEARIDDVPDDPTMSVVMRARMPAERARRFGQMIEALAEEFVRGAPATGETFGFVAGIYVPNWTRPSRAGRPD